MIPAQDRIPAKWEQEFVISLSYSGSMSGAGKEIQFSYTECVYTYTSPSGPPKTYKRKMTPTLREEILNKMRALNFDKIKSEGGVYAVNDGWNQSICLGSFCIEGGTSAEMSRDDKNRFLEAFNYLEELALNKKK